MNTSNSEEYKIYLNWCKEHLTDNTPARWIAFAGARNSANTESIKEEIKKLKEQNEKLVNALKLIAAPLEESLEDLSLRLLFFSNEELIKEWLEDTLLARQTLKEIQE